MRTSLAAVGGHIGYAVRPGHRGREESNAASAAVITRRYCIR